MSRTIILILCCLALASCNTQTKRVDQAKTLYMEGVQLREQRLSKEAAECFLKGLDLLRGCEKTEKVLLLEGQLCDNLGAMYLKHGLFEDAFVQHSKR